MTELIPFDFEEQAVRVVMRDGEPWFVAADVCRVLEILNTSDAVKRLDEDEVTLDLIEGNHRPTNLISESGLYALVIRSDKPAARRFRKWITSEVLPSIRRTGRYDHPLAPPAEADVSGDIAGLTFREAELWLGMVREARLTRGTKAGAAIWARSPLPQFNSAATRIGVDPAEAQACLDWLIANAPVRLSPALIGDDGADALLTPLGLRLLEDGLFVGNGASVFARSKWAGGLHQPMLKALPGVTTPPGSRSFHAFQMRGVLIPYTLLAGFQLAGGSDA